MGDNGCRWKPSGDVENADGDRPPILGADYAHGLPPGGSDHEEERTRTRSCLELPKSQ